MKVKAKQFFFPKTELKKKKKQKQNLQIHQTMEVKHLYAKNYSTLRKEIEND